MLSQFHKKHILVVAGVLLLVALLVFAKPTVFRPKVRNELLPQTVHLKKTVVPSGREVYQVTQAAEIWPKIIEATIDPPDVHVGDVQKLSIIVQSPNAIASVEAHIETDHGTKIVALKRTAETTSSLVYAGEWHVEDTHNITYHTSFVAKDTAGHTNSITLAWSDACGIPAGGNWTNSTNCTISSPDGVDNGNVTLSAGTLTLNSVFAWNPGKSLTISGSAAIALASGGQFKKTYLWAIDADGDGYPDDGTQYTQDNAPTNGRRRYLVTGANIDCNPADPNQFTNADQWTDADGDGHAGTDVTVCAQGGTIGSNDDCNDSNANIFQNQIVEPDQDSDAYADSYINPLAPPQCVGALQTYVLACSWVGGGGGSCATAQYNDQYGCASWRAYAGARKDGTGALIIDSSVGGFTPPGCPAL